ncbi:hypothetical protein H2248_003673 [Termitomyces sp. 'cryptogamus']|nr:hypothetical protein H2248_003673 [Termitomyces sp. 'cryptogamus']
MPSEIENSRHTSAAHQTQGEARYDDNLAGPSGVKSIQKGVRRHRVSSFARAASHHPISSLGGFPTLPSEIWIPDIREYTQPSATTRGLPSALGRLKYLKRPRSTALSEGNGDSDGPLPSDNATETDHTRNEGRHTFVTHQRVGEARHDNNLAGPSVVYLTSIESVHRDVQPVVDEYKVKALIDRFVALFGNKEEYKKLLNCRDNAQKLLNLFQRLSDIVVEPPPGFQRHLIVATQRLAAASGLYPASYELTNVTIPKTSEKSGGFGDVYKGHFRGQEVSIKVLRLYQNQDMGKLMKVFTREAILWSQLRHPNLLPFYGVYSHDGRVSFVAPWMENGDIGEYLKRNQTSNRVVLVYDTAQGLEFLHKNGIIHGDLKGANVLVNKAGRARLADFGFSSISDKEILAWSSLSTAASKGGTIRWQAPELFEPESDDIHNTHASDIWAWACVAYEVFAGELPYAHLTREAAIMKYVPIGMRPTQPPVSSSSWSVWGLTEDIWSLMEACWVAQPAERPPIQEVNRRLAIGLPADFQADTLANDVSFSPGEFREMMRKGKGNGRVSDEDEISVEIFERLLNE